MDKKEFMRQWGVSGMPVDKMRLANAAWDAAIETAAEDAKEWAMQYVTKDSAPINVKDFILAANV